MLLHAWCFYRVRGTVHAFQKILSEGGVRGLWKGSIPNMQRAALVNLGDLTTYDSAKQFILTHTSLPDSHTVHMLSRWDTLHTINNLGGTWLCTIRSSGSYCHTPVCQSNLVNRTWVNQNDSLGGLKHCVTTDLSLPLLPSLKYSGYQIISAQVQVYQHICFF